MYDGKECILILMRVRISFLYSSMSRPTSMSNTSSQNSSIIDNMGNLIRQGRNFSYFPHKDSRGVCMGNKQASTIIATIFQLF